ncbi:MAG: DUF2807 domain-containing protein [Prevotella sp.]|nr:DUF2807 domain-containing protein [Prevotella sp.]
MKQKTMILIALTALVVLVGSCNWKVEKKVNLSGAMATIPDVEPFERIRIDAICDVHYTQGETAKVKIVASDSEVMKKIDVMVLNGCLDIRSKGKGWSNWRKKRTVSVYVTSPDLIEVDMHGVGSFKAEGNLDTDTLRLRLKGTGDMDFQNIICDRIEAHLEGVGNMDLHQLQTQHAEISLKGVGDLDAHFVKSGSVVCTLRGVGDIDLSGEVKSLQKRKQGTGKIDISNLKINN